MELQLKSDRSRSRAAKQFCQSHKIKTVDRVAAHLQSCGISTTFSHHATITLNPRCSCRHGSSHPVTTRSCQPLPRSPGRLFDSSTRTRKAQSSGLHRAKSNNLPFSGSPQTLQTRKCNINNRNSRNLSSCRLCSPTFCCWAVCGRTKLPLPVVDRPGTWTSYLQS